MDLTGRTIVVTGAAAGIGAAVRAQLLETGAHVIALDRHRPKDERGTYIPLDLSDPESIRSVLAQLPQNVHALANIAGLPGTQPGEMVMKVNFLGTRLLTEGIVNRMDSGASVVNVASIAGASWQLNLEKLAQLNATEDFASGLAWSTINAPSDGSAAYNFSKEAVLFYTKHRSASAWKRGIRMNTVSPGATATGILQDFKESMPPGSIDWSEQLLGRHAAPEEIAPIIVFLLGPGSTFINGVDIPVDGGLIAGLTVGALSQGADSHA